ncbi:MAG: ZIP family metal transporter [Candidatus Limivicinus sp.]|jgi:ZIP family zinc transporter
MHHSLLCACGGTGFIFLMTILGAALVFCFRGEINSRVHAVTMGFAGGIMTAASVWSLLLPAIEQSRESLKLACWLPAALGLILGALFLGTLDALTAGREYEAGGLSPCDRLLVTAITLHNIPEGMAVGLAFAIASDGPGLAAAAALALGIGVQNFPEGAAVSLPLRESGLKKGKAFLAGVLSGAVEPAAGLLAVLAAALIHPLMPWLLSFAAGAMLYVTVQELIPGAGGIYGTASYMGGFTLMMVLDVALG